jgi:hypothetical protein
MSAPILNRKGELPSDGWYQIEVAGEWPAGEGRRQIIDEKAMTSIVNRFTAEKAAAGDNWMGLLVDKDHLSHDLENPTDAMAWLQSVEIRNGELWGQLDLSDEGEAAVKGKRYKRFSTEYDPEDLEVVDAGRVRPLRLAGLAFTNRPNNRGGKPISNRSEQPGGQKHNDNKPTMKSIAEKLGLPADADEAAILDAITKLQSEAKTAKDKAAEVEADAVLNRFGPRVPEAAKAGWRAQLITNRADTEKLMEDTLPAADTKQPERIHNRENAKTPPAVGAKDKADEQQQETEARAIRNRATELQKASNGRRGWKECWDQAESERGARN